MRVYFREFVVRIVPRGAQAEAASWKYEIMLSPQGGKLTAVARFIPHNAEN
jgi:hypothetical protein